MQNATARLTHHSWAASRSAGRVVQRARAKRPSRSRARSSAPGQPALPRRTPRARASAQSR
eukprot:377061-Pyramimonas_sp.AAC.1